jgi:pimeloyl-ACP methyl ester carboxylesterase
MRSEARAVEHRKLGLNGIEMHIAEQGSGPLVLLCHGFPETWYSYRHQLPALAAAGYHAVAPDMRGYGQTSRPEAIDQYTILHLVGDMVGLLDALGEESAVIVGHDWGASVAWSAALLRPDRFRAVVGLSVPFRRRGPRPPTQLMPRTESEVFYQLHFQEPGVAEAEFERNPRDTLARIMFGGSGSAPQVVTEQGTLRFSGMVTRGGSFVDRLGPSPESLPSWFTQADLDYYTAEFERTGFAGGLNWYRNMDRNWQLLAPFQGALIQVPALFIAGESDMVLRFPGVDQVLADMAFAIPKLRPVSRLPGCGHWTQQERPPEVNALLLEFLRSL